MAYMQWHGRFEEFNEGVARMYRFAELALRWAYSLTARIVRSAVPSPARVLEVGPGTGVLMNMLSASGYYVIGVDASLPMLRRARRLWKPDIINGVSLSLPLVDDYFDAAVAMFTLHHWGDYDTSLRSLYRVLRRHAAFIVVEFDGDRVGWSMGHSCSAKCLLDALSPYFDVVIRRRFPLIMAIARRLDSPALGT
jgi:ubiquinone/menaquinone biosynthesis C-methylase UbiE